LEEYTEKGNLNEYKIRLNDLEKIERDMKNHKDMVINSQFGQINAKLIAETQMLNNKYDDIIKNILVE
jgi:hypothetical protein